MAVMEIARVEELGGRPTGQLESEVRSLSAEIAAATCRLLLLVGELDRREAWRAWECRSCAHWLAWQCGTSLKAGYEHVRVGRALAALPEITAEFSIGRLSYSKVRALTRVATPETERELIGLARAATAAQLDRIVGGYERACRLAEPDLAAAQARRRAVWSEGNPDGTRTIHARLSPDVAAIVERAIEAAVETLPESVDRPDAPWQARRADALELVAREYLEPDSSRAPTTEIVAHVDVETLAADRPGRSEIEGGDQVCVETARRLACDARLTASLERAGSTLDVGRRTRSIPPALRRALVDRDRGRCRFAGCTSTRHLHAHHRRHWARGGRTERRNLVLLCPFHHRAVHEGGWRVEGDPEGALVFVPPGGHHLREVPVEPPNTDPDALRRHRVAHGRVIPGNGMSETESGGPLDLELALTAMDSLLQAEISRDGFDMAVRVRPATGTEVTATVTCAVQPADGIPDEMRDEFIAHAHAARHFH